MKHPIAPTTRPSTANLTTEAPAHGAGPTSGAHAPGTEGTEYGTIIFTSSSVTSVPPW